ncbi:hypothetical protein OPQ81_004782 [Rhizoctonia solani]|nr:hypothetical protein OPQ81_004782 [Rhizoctonia solani]
MAMDITGTTHNGTFDERGDRQTIRDRSLGIRDSSESSSVLEPQFILTDEPSSLTDKGSRSVQQGRWAIARTGSSPVHNGAQAEPLGLRMCGVRQELGKALDLHQLAAINLEIPSPNDTSSPASVTPAEDIREGAISRGISPREVAREQSIQVYRRRFFPKNASTTTLIDPFSRFPLRTGTDPTIVSYSVTDGGISIPSRTPKPPLHAGLYNGSFKLQSATSTLFILVIAITYNNVKDDPQHDLDTLKDLFDKNDPERTYFKSISGETATLETIEEAIGDFYREALKFSDSNMLILFTGEGDEINRMHLIGGEFITDEVVRRWMWKLQIDHHPNNRAVTVILDYCRMNPDISLGARSTHAHLSPLGVEFIWSCSPGQTAAVIKYKSAPNIPRSCFLLALMMASYSNWPDYHVFWSLYIKRVTVPLVPCIACSKNEPCPRPPPRPQDPDWEHAGSMDSVYDLVDRLSKMDVVSEIHDLFMSKTLYREAIQLPPTRITSQPNSSPHSGTMKSIQGSPKQAHAALTVQKEPRQSEQTDLDPMSTSTRNSQDSLIIAVHTSENVPEHSLSESPLDTHPCYCMRISGYPFPWCTCFSHEL